MIAHCYNRGTRKNCIFHDTADYEYFLQALFFLNHSVSIPHLFQELRIHHQRELETLTWPSPWRMRDPLVAIHAFIAMPNHFHLLLEEIKPKGISRFMQKLGTALACHYNAKYQTVGALFEGSYKMKTAPLLYGKSYGRFAVYIQVKNAFELYPGGFDNAVQHFDDAFEFASSYKYGSLGHWMGKWFSPIVARSLPMFFDIKEYARLRLGLGEA